MSDFTVIRVSGKPPRSWSFRDNKTGSQVPMETYNVMLEGEDEAVEVNRKPNDKPTVGEVLNGTLESTEYGKRFKKARVPYTPKPGGYMPKDEVAIKAMWAIGQAVAMFTSGKDETIADIERNARDLFNMVDRVKTGQISGYEKAKAVAQSITTKAPALDEVYPLKDEINLDDIPF